MAAWFKPRRYGYGAVPIVWQGWALVVGFVVAVVALIWATLGFDNEGRSAAQFAIYFAGVAVLVVALLVIARRKTDGEWRWRWGENEQERK